MLKENYYHCPKCGHVTKHIQISFKEFVSAKGRGVGDQLFAMFTGLTGIDSLMTKLTGGGEYKCCECALVNQRYPDGGINEDWNK